MNSALVMCNQWWMRLISFLTALFMSVVIFVFPQVIASDPQQLNHGLLSVMLLAVCVCFVHGVGFVIQLKILSYLISPLVTLPVLLIVSWRLWA